MVLIIWFSIAGVDVNSSSTVTFTSRSKILFVIVVALTDSFKILITQRYFFFFILFFIIDIFASIIAVLGTIEGITIGRVEAEFSLTGFYLPKQKFFGMVNFFSFSIY